MAKLTSLLQFSGTLDGISIYKMEGVKDPIVRRKGGARRDKILHDPCFINTRRCIGEFGGRSTATRLILQAFKPLQTGRGTTGALNHLLSVIQKMDAHNKWGQRAVALSMAPELLQGLNISRRLTLDHIIPNLLSCTLSKESLKGRVEVPALLPGVNCTHPTLYPFFRIVAVLGVTPDMFYDERLDCFLPEKGFKAIPAQKEETPWRQTNVATEAASLELQLPSKPGVEHFSLLLSVAFEYGRNGVSGAIEPAPKAMASKIMATI